MTLRSTANPMRRVIWAGLGLLALFAVATLGRRARLGLPPVCLGTAR